MEKVDSNPQSLCSFKRSFYPSLSLNPELLEFFTIERLDVSAIETKKLKYLDRKLEIERMKKLQGQKSQLRDDKLRRNKEEMTKIRLSAQNRQEEHIQKQQKEFEHLCSAQKMMSSCPNIQDIKTAEFYLEAQNWDLDVAIQTYAESSGDTNIVGYQPKNLCTIKFILPTGAEFVEKFDKSQQMWCMLSKIYERLPEQRNFCVKTSRNAQPIKFEDMTQITFSSFGIGANSTLIVEYI